MYIVYRYMIDDQWIYVGKTKTNINNRLVEHFYDNRFEQYRHAKISYCEFSNETDMDITEIVLIKTMKPLLNIYNQTEDVLPFIYCDKNIEWKDFKFIPPKKISGRPIKGEEQLILQKKLRIGPKMDNEILRCSKNAGITWSEFVRQAIREYINRSNNLNICSP